MTGRHTYANELRIAAQSFWMQRRNYEIGQIGERILTDTREDFRELKHKNLLSLFRGLAQVLNGRNSEELDIDVEKKADGHSVFSVFQKDVSTESPLLKLSTHDFHEGEASRTEHIGVKVEVNGQPVQDLREFDCKGPNIIDIPEWGYLCPDHIERVYEVTMRVLHSAVGLDPI
jgi:hypothetical protein